MSTLLVDDALVHDMAAALFAVRSYLMMLAEEWSDMDASALDDLLRRYTTETGRPPPRVRDTDDRA